MKRLFLASVSVLALCVASGCQVGNNLKLWQLRIENHVPESYLHLRVRYGSAYWDCEDEIRDSHILSMVPWSGMTPEVNLWAVDSRNHVIGIKMVSVDVPKTDIYEGPYLNIPRIKPSLIIVDFHDVNTNAQLAVGK
jgi:hypothetical protein